jgi:hypothetical protein
LEALNVALSEQAVLSQALSPYASHSRSKHQEWTENYQDKETHEPTDLQLEG